DGDVVLLQRVEPQRSGEVCAVRVGEDESTLKYLEWSPPRSGDRPERYRLRPHNPIYTTLTVPAAELHIDGVMRGLIRGDVVQDLLFEGSGWRPASSRSAQNGRTHPPPPSKRMCPFAAHSRPRSRS